jgi:hypothetical protein
MTGAEAIRQAPDHSKLYLEYLCKRFIIELPAPDLEIYLRQPGHD